MLKKAWIVVAVTVLTSVIVTGWVVPTMLSRREEVVSSSTPSGEAMYYLGITDGRAAVFDRDRRTVLTRLDIPLRTLPQEERNRLAQGIPVYSEAELQQYLEDYS